MAAKRKAPISISLFLLFIVYGNLRIKESAPKAEKSAGRLVRIRCLVGLHRPHTGGGKYLFILLEELVCTGMQGQGHAFEGGGELDVRALGMGRYEPGTIGEHGLEHFVYQVGVQFGTDGEHGLDRYGGGVGGYAVIGVGGNHRWGVERPLGHKLGEHFPVDGHQDALFGYREVGNGGDGESGGGEGSVDIEVLQIIGRLGEGEILDYDVSVA